MFPLGARQRGRTLPLQSPPRRRSPGCREHDSASPPTHPVGHSGNGQEFSSKNRQRPVPHRSRSSAPQESYRKGIADSAYKPSRSRYLPENNHTHEAESTGGSCVGANDHSPASPMGGVSCASRPPRRCSCHRGEYPIHRGPGGANDDSPLRIGGGLRFKCGGE